VDRKGGGVNLLRGKKQLTGSSKRAKRCPEPERACYKGQRERHKEAGASWGHCQPGYGDSDEWGTKIGLIGTEKGKKTVSPGKRVTSKHRAQEWFWTAEPNRLGKEGKIWGGRKQAETGKNWGCSGGPTDWEGI